MLDDIIADQHDEVGVEAEALLLRRRRQLVELKWRHIGEQRITPSDEHVRLMARWHGDVVGRRARRQRTAGGSRVGAARTRQEQGNKRLPVGYP